MGQFPLQQADLAGRELGEVGGFGVEAADELVEVLDRAFLPAGVGVGVVDGAPKDGGDPLRIEEEDVVVQQKVVHGEPVVFEFLGDASEGGVEGVAGGPEKATDVGFVVVEGEDKREEAAFAALPGTDEVALANPSVLPVLTASERSA